MLMVLEVLGLFTLRAIDAGHHHHHSCSCLRGGLDYHNVIEVISKVSRLSLWPKSWKCTIQKSTQEVQQLVPPFVITG